MANPARILMHYNGTFCPLEGVGRVILNLGGELEKSDLIVQYLFGSGASEPYANYLNFFKSRWLRVLRHTPLTVLLFMYWIRDKDYDIVHSNTPEAAFDAIWAKFFLRKKYRVIIQFHGLDTQLLEDYLAEWKKVKFQLSWLTIFYLLLSSIKTRLCVNRADAIVAISTAVKNEIRVRWNCDVTIISNGVSTKEFYPMRVKNLSAKDDVYRILFVGNIAWRKGLFYLLQAINGMSVRIHLTCVGLSNPPWLQNWTADCITFIPKLSTSELNQYYNRSDVLVVPSINEPFGLIYLEGMATGLPVVGSYGTGAEDLIKNGKTGWLCEKGNVDSLRACIKRVMQLGKKSFSKSAIDTAHKFSWAHCANQYRELYVNFLKK
ncbi:MAG: glycosyltransferase family 4 protein [Candidatus Iainarchaeum archaeon]|uniref:Glycosyltransferase family 4 protein n=1 Tax=Candidatus Iainarchaeum sp. TaxID=3101447 RepID=A0A7T9DKS8_9ARCH|nr:MAG: glycosyltransferase family 4 protein [Candidatus Diapherotrites archaeon]